MHGKKRNTKFWSENLNEVKFVLFFMTINETSSKTIQSLLCKFRTFHDKKLFCFH